MPTSDLIWAMEPIACERLLKALASAAAQPVTAGPATDAAGAGLPVRVTGSTAIVPLQGPMMRRPGYFARYFFGATGTEEVRAAVQAAAADDDIDTIVLAIDSPGGAANGTLELAGAVSAAASVKRVIAQVAGDACSAAYWVASQASEIYAGPNDMVGSIGTRLMLYDYSQMFENEGIEAVPIDTGEFKSAGALGTEITAAQRADFQRLVDGMQKEFSRAVASGRSLSAEQLKEVADGRIFLGSEAVKLGLIDKVQTMEATLAGLSRPARRGRATAAAKASLALMALDID